MSNTPESPLESPPQESRSLWKPIGITILSTFVLAIICCSGGNMIASMHLERVAMALLLVGIASFGSCALALLFAFLYMLYRLLRKTLSR